ncbi:hypothetical protein PCANC_07790 [Puccinia coronata f. sp. avenae]|uniref:BED-type domain-containing protein n=1 Tax=Puccinia coronata f. sp. avenae TaxID=200324 RepID=A0A2N5VHJ2_9BASI|nr:hypothetical protein PCASD_26444 [Puccinia coronata f. sp. avenae]PLW49376.1 hypothetical protein PCANC_07790 [Puccinia coronata f. sp. avenae]
MCMGPAVPSRAPSYSEPIRQAVSQPTVPCPGTPFIQNVRTDWSMSGLQSFAFEWIKPTAAQGVRWSAFLTSHPREPNCKYRQAKCSYCHQVFVREEPARLYRHIKKVCLKIPESNKSQYLNRVGSVKTEMDSRNPFPYQRGHRHVGKLLCSARGYHHQSHTQSKQHHTLLGRMDRCCGSFILLLDGPTTMR